MTLFINPEDRKTVDELRIMLAQITVDMTEVFTHDANSQKKKTAVLVELAGMRKTMDALGLTHSMSAGNGNARGGMTAIEFLGVRV